MRRLLTFRCRTKDCDGVTREMIQSKKIDRERHATLNRQTVTISREAEFFSEAELTVQTGYGRDYWWPQVIANQLIDNSLDACEESGISPVIKLRFSGNEFSVADNGPGLEEDTITKILNFGTRTSTKIAYPAPTRGQQGNAWKTILAIPFVLSGACESVATIESLGIRHTINVSLDQIEKRPRILRTPEKTVKKAGTLVALSLNRASSQTTDPESGILPKLLAQYVLFNPHTKFELTDGGQQFRWNPTMPDWRKWLPSDPTSPHWYSVERLEDLIGAYISNGEKNRLVRDFVAEFRGLTSTAKRKQVSADAGVDRHLGDLAIDGRFERKKLERLLAAMQAASAPVKPEIMGLLGKAHFEQRIAGGKTFRYSRALGIDDRNLPFCIEAAFGVTGDETLRGQHIGLNWSVPLTNPLQDVMFPAPSGDHDGLGSLLASQHIDVYDERDPVCFVVHMICPRFDFLDRGKGSVSLSQPMIEALTKSIHSVTKEWAQIKQKEYRQRRRDQRERERYHEGRSQRITIKEAAWSCMSQAYLEASGHERHLPAQGRQVYYAARRPILRLTEASSLNADYFTQTLLPEYQREHPEETATWDVVYDARGHFFEPHTGREVPLGTIAVREYLAAIGKSVGAELPHPDLSSSFPTIGPLNRYAAVLLIEKEGFAPLLATAQFAERYDLAIMSSKGMNTTAARTLIDCLPEQVPIFVLHDFDKAGFSILATLTQDNRRYTYSNAPRVIDLGLRLADAKKWKLEAETVHYGKSDPRANLEANGANPEEISFLCAGKDWHGYHGQRVELNAFMSDQFVEWLDAKLTQHGVKKVIPSKDVLEKEYVRQAAISRLQEMVDKAHEQVLADVAKLKVPRDLHKRIAGMLAANPAMPWDVAVIVALDAEKRSGRK